jgi:parallel beta-helix repeat protein
MPFKAAAAILPEKGHRQNIASRQEQWDMRIKSIAVAVMAVALAGRGAAMNTPITTCPFIITAPGHYFLVADLGPCSGPFAIQIAASDVRLLLVGHTITCSGGGTITEGISATAVQKIKIEGPGTITNCRLGIHWQNVDHSAVHQVRAARNLSGFLIDGSSGNNRFRGNVANENAFSGFFLNGATNSRLEENVANSNDRSGIALISGGGHKLVRNMTNGNGFADPGMCNALGAGIAVVSSGNQLAKNTANSNCEAGVGVFTGSTDNRILENTALGNLRFDLFDLNPNCDANVWVQNNFVSSNQGCIH